MGWKGNIVEVPVWLCSRFVPTWKEMPKEPKSIFVLRNNDLGDLLVVTPLFEALRRRFPNTHIAVGIGDWAVDILKSNPYIDEIVPMNAPWSNKFTRPQRTRDVARYIYFSAESQQLAEKNFEIGIDILGSHVGSALMMHSKIPYRLGVYGYHGGHSATQQSVQYNENEHVGRSALRFAELLGATELPACRPQIFLTEAECQKGENCWKPLSLKNSVTRIIVGPGGGFQEKCWPLESYKELLDLISKAFSSEIIVVGGKQDRDAGAALVAAVPNAKNLAGELSLRDTFAVVKASDLVLSNPSMLLHTASAFRVPNFVMLGDYFPSASQHQMQWGYPETCWSLGKDKERKTIFTPGEALAQIQENFRFNK